MVRILKYKIMYERIIREENSFGFLLLLRCCGFVCFWCFGGDLGCFVVCVGWWKMLEVFVVFLFVEEGFCFCVIYEGS